MKKRNILNRILIIIAIICFAIIFMLNRVWVANYNSQLDELNLEVSEIANDYAESIILENNNLSSNDDQNFEETSLTSSDIINYLNNISDTANRIVYLENQYINSLYGDDVTVDNYEDLQNEWNEWNDEISSYFENVNSSAGWYVWNIPEVSAEWKSSVFLDYVNDASLFYVLFYCEDVNNNLLAYAITSYNVNDSLFYDCVVQMTNFGQEEMIREGIDEEESEGIQGSDVSDENFQEGVSSIVDAMKDLWDENDHEVEPNVFENEEEIDEVDEEQ